MPGRAIGSNLTSVFGKRDKERSHVGRRLDEARATIRRHEPASPALVVLDEIERSLEGAVLDCLRLEATIEQLNPSAATRDLKVVLRQRADVTMPDTTEVTALRRRHDTVHDLMNRLHRLRTRMDRTLVDVDTLVAQCVTASIGTHAHDSVLDEQIRQLTHDAAVLTSARDEVAQW